MSELGRWLVVVGVATVAVGAVVWLLGHVGFRGLPGDIRVESGGKRLYIPIVTSLVVSAILTGMLWLWRWWSGR